MVSANRCNLILRGNSDRELHQLKRFFPEISQQIRQLYAVVISAVHIQIYKAQICNTLLDLKELCVSVSFIHLNELSFSTIDFSECWFCCDMNRMSVVITAVAQRKKSLSDSWMAGSECRYWPDRKASLWAYLHGAGTRIVPGQFQYKWHILKVSLVWGQNNDVLWYWYMEQPVCLSHTYVHLNLLGCYGYLCKWSGERFAVLYKEM